MVQKKLIFHSYRERVRQIKDFKVIFIVSAELARQK